MPGAILNGPVSNETDPMSEPKSAVRDGAPVVYVDSPAGLAELCDRLAPSPWIALDTEFMREKTYRPQLCLLQLATADHIACVDPLAIPDLAPLLDLLHDPERLKVLHAARQDLEIFYLLRGEVPAPVFDTQLAATLLGHGDQVGYGALVRNELGVELDKNQARTDWAKRPLDPAQLAYAADDVRYLAQLYPQLRERLEALGRLEWLREDFTVLTDAGTYRADPERAWLRISGNQKLKGRQLAVLQHLAAWRERRAEELDRPRRWVLGDQVLLDLARLMPSDMAKLGRIRGLEAGAIGRHGTELLGLIREGKAVPQDQWPERPGYVQLTPEQDALVDALMAVLRIRSAELGISTSMLATRKDLERLAAGAGPELPVLSGWRGEAAGQTLLAFLDGRLSLHAEAGRLRLG